LQSKFMLVLLPLISFITTFLIIDHYYQRWRESLLITAIYWGIFITVITEILSLVKAVSLFWLSGSWILNCIILIYIYWRIRPQRFNFWQLKQSFKNQLSNFPHLIIILISGVGLVLATVGLIALIAPSNNWDSMDYHMTRVVHWIQHHSIAHYPTAYTPQLYQKPWSEFLILHLQILSGSDYFANLVQWLSMVGSAIGVSLVAKQLEADIKGQVFSAVFCVTIPMGILQASSTQNDYVVAFWLVCLAYYTLVTVQIGKSANWTHQLLIGGSLGLAILSKGTAYVYALPFLILWGLGQIKYYRWQVYKSGLIVGSVSLLLIFPHYIRNYILFTSPLGEPSGYTNEIMGLNVLISNVLKNLSLHSGTPINLFSGILNRIIQIIHSSLLGIDVSDPRTTFSRTFFVPGGWGTIGINGNENSAGNFLHLVLIIICITIFMLRKSIRKNGYTVAYFIVVISSFLLFCYLLKWQSWNSRLHLPFFVLMSSFIGVVLGGIRQSKVAIAVMFVLLLTSLPWLLSNRYRPLVGSNNIFIVPRIEQYFSNRPRLQKPYVDAVDFLNSKECTKIGLLMGSDPWEYPLWILLEKDKTRTFRIQHVNVKNISGKLEQELPYKEFEPCGIMAMETKKSKQDKKSEVNFRNQTYTRAWSGSELAVFIKK
jgi:4-amino-4-deoxy-L-arabinose transferase-like glycosyltransferase